MDRRLVVWTGGVLALLAIGALIYLARLPPDRRPREEAIVPIPLAGGVEPSRTELSGLDWYGDTLVLMPQYPSRHGDALFAIERDAIESFLDHPGEAPLAARRVALDARGVQEAIEGFDGFEAIVFVDDQVFFAVEGNRDETRFAGFVVRGHVEGDLARIVLEPERYAAFEAQNDLANTGYETLLRQGDRLLAIYETNGEVNPRPYAVAIDRDLARRANLPVRHLEYRVTDATSVDAEGRFWVANYHWPGAPWASGACSLTERYGQGESHARCATVERLVEMQITDLGIQPTDRPPILFELVDDEHARNWEGLVRLEGRGFLVVTDEHPDTILAFVPGP